jgi:hypothetical protein
MSTLSPERWKALSPHLDRALTLGTEERAAWLAELRRSDAALAADLGILLEEHQELARAGFLGRSPVPPPIEPLREGHMLGPYTLVAPIGSGGMGAVWLAHRSDGRFERRVAVKFPSFALMDSSGQERFKRKGRSWAGWRMSTSPIWWMPASLPKASPIWSSSTWTASRSMATATG